MVIITNIDTSETSDTSERNVSNTTCLKIGLLKLPGGKENAWFTSPMGYFYRGLSQTSALAPAQA